MRDFQILFDDAGPSLIDHAGYAPYGKLGFPAPHSERPWTYANFVQSIDGVASFKGSHASGADISQSAEDRWLMDLLRAHADAIQIGALLLFGQLSVAAAPVTATQTPPNASWTETFTGFETAGVCSTVSSPVPAGKALVVTSITVYVESVTAANATVSVHAATLGSPCTSRLSADYVGDIARGESKVIPFTTGFPVKPGRVIGLTIGSTSGDAVALVTTHGYLVSSALCTVTGPPAGCH